MSIQIAIFASGAGSNARRLMEYFDGHAHIRVALLISNRSDSGALEIARAFGVPAAVIPKAAFNGTGAALETLTHYQIDYIVLAGFLLLVPQEIIRRYSNKILNIHPALLPKYGGKGMYGTKIHEAVRAANESETGISIHFANEHYDEGSLIFQAKCTVGANDSAEDIARNVLKLEHAWYPKVAEAIIMGKK